jgi:hypothetical protein
MRPPGKDVLEGWAAAIGACETQQFDILNKSLRRQ